MATTRSLVSRFRMRELKQALLQADDPTRPVSVNNPFIPRKNPQTNCWAPPRYSLRRQAELVKKARLEGTVHLLPPGPKLPLVEHLAAQQDYLARKTNRGKNKADSKPAYDIPVEWQGEVKECKSPDADIGNRLYAEKKRMFKGHKWERVYQRRRRYQRILMRDMAKRIWRWRRRRVLRKPDPLSKPRPGARESQKLPF